MAKKGQGRSKEPYSYRDLQCQYCFRIYAGPHRSEHHTDDVPGTSTRTCPTCKRVANRLERLYGLRYAIDEMARRAEARRRPKRKRR